MDKSSDKATLFEKFDGETHNIFSKYNNKLFGHERYSYIRSILLNNQDINGKYYGDGLLTFFSWLNEELALDLLNCQDPNLDLNIQNYDGQTALHLAVKENNIKLVKALLKYYE